MPVPDTSTKALLTSTPTNELAVTIVCWLAESVIPPLTVVIEDPAASAMFRAAVMATAPVPLVAMSAFALASEMPVVVLNDWAVKFLLTSMVTD